MSLLDLSTAQRLRIANQDAREIRIADQTIFTRGTWIETRRNLTRSPRGTDLSYFACTLGTLATSPTDGAIFTRTDSGAVRAVEIKVGTEIGPGTR